MTREGQRAHRLLVGRWHAAAILVASASAVAVAGLSSAYWHQGSPGRLDLALQSALNPLSATSRDLLDTIVWLGDWRVVTVLTAAIALTAYRSSGARVAAFSVAATTIAAATSELMLKPLVDRRLDGDLAFPSGHSTGITAIAMVAVILVVALRRPGRAAQFGLISAASAVMLAVSFALTALGQHYATDAIGGVLVGVGVVNVVALGFDMIGDARLS